jgi:hypothetical protein
MTVTGGEPPSFPRVGDSTNTPAPTSPSGASLFTSPIQIIEPATPTDAPAHPSASRGSRLRYFVAALATLVVFAVVGGVIFLAAPRAGTASEVAHYAPAGVAAYFEVRLDLPGDQHQNLAALMSHFPGFADQSAFQQKLDDTLDSVLKAQSDSKLDWNNDVKPWFGGQIALFGSPGAAEAAPACPSVTACAGYMSGSGAIDMVFVLTVSDRSKLEAELTAQLGTTTPTTTSYQGTDIDTVNPASMDGQSLSYAVTDTALIASPNVDLVKQALDVHAGQAPALADDTFFTQQLGQLHADRLATFYYDAAKAMATMPGSDLSGLAGSDAACMQAFESTAKVKYVGELRAESDHFAVTVRSQIPSGNGLPAPANDQTTLAQSMPSDTLAYMEVRNTGASIGWLIKQELACVASAAGSNQALPSGLDNFGVLGGDPSKAFEQILGTSPDTYFDFIDDAALGVTYRNSTLDGGIVATVDDQAVATQRIDKLTTVLGLVGTFGGGSGAPGITSEQVQHNGTTITVIHYAPPADLYDGSSVPAGTGSVDLAIATTNGRLYLGTQGFVTGALDQDAGSSLASSAGYQKATSAAPQSNAGVMYLDVTGLRSTLETLATSDNKQQYEQDEKPFLTPLDTFAGVSHVDGDMVVFNGFLYVR